MRKFDGKLRILIVDDHAIVRQGLVDTLSVRQDLVIAGEAGTGAQALDAIDDNLSLVMLDLSLPDMNGFELLEKIVKNHPDLSVLVLSMHEEKQYAVRALKAGASGYVTKVSAPEELTAAINKIMTGGVYLSGDLYNSVMLGLFKEDGGLPHESLSNRELQTMLGLASGKSPGEIAISLGISVKTVSTYRARIMEKLELESNADIIKYAIRHGLISNI